MILRLYKPRPELQHLVSRIMVNSFQLDATNPRPTNPFPPQPEPCLYFYPHDKVLCRNYANGSTDELPQSHLVGPQLSRVDLTMGYNMLVIMVGFQPGGMHRLLRIPMHEMRERSFDSTLILGNEIQMITEQLAEVTDSDKMIEIIELYLLRKARGLKRMIPIEEVLMRMLEQKNMVNVDQLAKQACVSIRQLERQFKERTGMPPKVFSRLVRFSRAWVMHEKRPDLSWLHIAHSCDYADQMHMIRDFKEFAGVTPGVLQSALEKSPLRLQASSHDYNNV
jgi:AraC-like DNA-binding protein